MSEPCEPNLFVCVFCGEYFTYEQMEKGEPYCKECFTEMENKAES